MRNKSDDSRAFTRRQVLLQMAALSGAAALGPILSACRSAFPGSPSGLQLTPTASPTSAPTRAPREAPTDSEALGPTDEPEPSETPDPAIATVVLVKTADRSDGVRRALQLVGQPSFEGLHVLLKPNLNSSDRAPGATHPDVLRALVGAIQASGAGAITVGDRSGMGDTPKVMRDLGVADMASEMGFETVAFEELPDEEWVVVNEPGHHWSRGFPVPSLLHEVDAVVQTCNLKTHRHGGHFTMSLKNSIGLVGKHLDGYNFMDELHDSDAQRLMIAEANAAYEPALVLVDGVEAFVKGGPDTGVLADTEVVLAGTDRVAIDAVGVAILRLFGTTADVERGPVFEQEQIARAAALGLGVDSPDNIRIVSDDSAGNEYAARVMDVLLAST